MLRSITALRLNLKNKCPLISQRASVLRHQKNQIREIPKKSKDRHTKIFTKSDSHPILILVNAYNIPMFLYFSFFFYLGFYLVSLMVGLVVKFAFKSPSAIRTSILVGNVNSCAIIILALIPFLHFDGFHGSEMSPLWLWIPCAASLLFSLVIYRPILKRLTGGESKNGFLIWAMQWATIILLFLILIFHIRHPNY